MWRGIQILRSDENNAAQNLPVGEISKETGLQEATLYQWKKQAKAKGLVAPREQEPERWSTEDKFLVVMETAGLN